MQLSIHTDQNVAILEHNQDTNRQEQVRYGTIERNTSIGSCRFRIVDTALGQIWIGDYSMNVNYTLQATQPAPGLLIVIQCTPGPGVPVVPTRGCFPIRSISWLAQTSNHIKMSFPRGNGHLLMFNYENGSTGLASTYTFQQSWLTKSQRQSPVNSQLLNLAQAILKYPLINDYLQVYLRIKAEELNILLLNEAERTSATTPLPTDVIEKMQALDNLVRESLDVNYNVAQLARLSCLSISNLKKYGKVYFSKSIHQHLLSVKMGEAQKRILHTQQSLEDIAFNLGFKNKSNFSAAFKNYYGYPPGQLRKK